MRFEVGAGAPALGPARPVSMGLVVSDNILQLYYCYYFINWSDE